MHEWHTEKSKNLMRLIDSFMGFKFNTDYSGSEEVSKVKITERLFSDEDEAITFVTSSSYCGNTAYVAAYTTKKLSKAYQSAFSNFLAKCREYRQLKDSLTIAYGRKASKVTCPSCGSSINLKYGNRFKVCPVCGSNKIISDSNWKILDTKLRMAEKASETLQKEAEKNEVTFVCGIEWHC